MHKIGAFGIVEQNAKILVCHRRDMDMWDLPGGSVDPMESPWTAALREVKEESGLDVTATGRFVILHRPDQGELGFGFFCKPTGGRFTLSDEVRDMKFVPQNRLPAPFNHEEKSLLQTLATVNFTTAATFVQPGKSPREIYFELGPEKYANFNSPTTLLSLAGLSGQNCEI